MLKIYLDNCCYGRPFDPPSNPTIIFESEAKILIQTLVLNSNVELVSSFVLHEEALAIPNEEIRKLTIDFLDNAVVYVAKDKVDEVLALADDIMKTGVRYMDSAHIACAMIAECDYLVTTDKRLLKYKSEKINIINPIDFIRMWEDGDDAHQ